MGVNLAGVEKQVGYEYKGWKLGEKVKFKKDGRVYEIVGFDEGEYEEFFMAINYNVWDKNIRDSNAVTSYIYTDSNYFEWVSEDNIEKLETKKSKGGKTMLKRDMLRGVVSELQKRTGVRVSATRQLTSQDDCYNAILEIGKRNAAAKEVEVLSKVNIALNEINCDLKKENAKLQDDCEFWKKANESCEKAIKNIEKEKRKIKDELLDENNILFNENLILKAKIKNYKLCNKITFVLSIILIILSGVNLCNL